MRESSTSILPFPSSLKLMEGVSTPQKTNECDYPQISLDGKDESPKIRSLEALGSGIFTHRKQSAFSIYVPENDEFQSSHSASLDLDSPIQKDQQASSLKKNKNSLLPKDKRQQYRLETKNLNRFFRSKINEMLRDIKENPKSEEELRKADELLGRLNESNKIMFSEMRQIIKDEWLQAKLRKCTGMLMRYVHKGKMGMQSKLIMLKYFNKILKAIRDPDHFSCWK